MPDNLNPEEVKEELTETVEEAEAENPYSYVIRHPGKTYEAIKEDSKEFDKNGGYTAEELNRERELVESNIRELEQDNKRIDGEIKTTSNKISDIYREINRAKNNGENTDALETELHKLENQLDELNYRRKANNEGIERLSEKAEEIAESVRKIEANISEGAGRIGNIVKRTAKKVAKSPVNAAKKVFSSAESKVNPLNKPINKSDTTDTGVESIRLADKTVKTVRRDVKTTKRTIKTAGDTVKTTGKVIYKTGEFTVRAVSGTVRFAGAAVTHTVAAVMNPIFWILAMFLIIVVVVIAGTIVMLLAGGAAGASSNAQAQAGAAGLVDVPAQYQNGIEYYNTAINNKRNEFNSLIDSMYYNNNDLTHSDLSYMERTTANGSKTKYEKSFATDERKNTLKSAFDFTLSEREIIAIAYVYLEKQKNDANNTERGIYEVEFTQEVFDEIIAKCVMFTDTTYANQECPTKICTAHYYDNPAYAEAWAKQNASTSAYNEWITFLGLFDTYNSIHDGAAQAQYWENNVGWVIDNWRSVYQYLYGVAPYYSNSGRDYLNYLGVQYENYTTIANNTPQYLVEESCDHEHTLHSIGLAMFSKDDVMSALGFTDTYIEWEEMTERGFESNPNL